MRAIACSSLVSEQKKKKIIYCDVKRYVISMADFQFTHFQWKCKSNSLFHHLKLRLNGFEQQRTQTQNGTLGQRA